MKNNVGRADMIVRVIIGVVIAFFGIIYKSWWGLAAIIPLLTAFYKFCPLYTVFGCNTHPSKKEKEE